MKILHVIDSLGIGGAEILLKDLLDLLNEDEHIVCYLEKPDTLRNDLRAKRVFFLNYTSKWDIPRVVFSLRGIIKREEPSFVHSHLYKSTMICRFATWNQTKLISSIHTQLGVSLFSRSKIDLQLERLTISRKHFLIGVSKTVLDDYRKYVDFKGKSLVLYNIVRREFFALTPPSDLANFQVLKIIVVGNLKPVKNYPYLLQAISEIKNLPIEVHIYGEGNEREFLQKEIDRQNLPIVLKGAAIHIEKVLPNYHCFVTCSLYEGYGIAPMEAMAAGVPVLASDIPVYREVFGNLALYCNLNNSKSLSLLIIDILQKKIDLLGLSVRVKEHALEMVGENRYLASLKKIYEEVIDPLS